jgi:serine/threonine-protein kinase
MVGQSIGNYRITKLLGEGGMGLVYLAEHPGLGRRAAVKVLHPSLAGSDEMIQRLFNEARAANTIGHRGIVEVSDFGVLPSGAPYLVMEFLDGESLAVRVNAAGRLSLGGALEIADQIAGAVGAAHAKGIVHRDLKPDNIFLVRDPLLPGRELLKILDFGIAKLAPRPVSAGDVRTRTGAILGTPRYMSPEQCRDSREVDHRTDIYSLGVILYEMLSGEPPFVSSSWGELAHMHIGVTPPGLRTRLPDLPDNVDRIVQRALEKNPQARFQSMSELQGALKRATGSGTLLLLEPPVPAPEAGSTRRFDPPPAPRAPRRTTLTGAASEVQQRLRSSKHRRPVVAALVSGSLVVALAVAGLLRTEREPATVTAPAAAPVSPEPAPPLPQPAAAAPTVGHSDDKPGTISVEIVTTPEGARVIREKDGEPLGSTPLRQPWPRAKGDEPLRLELDGYQSERVIAPLDRDLSVTLELKEVAKPAAPSTAPAPSRHRPSEKLDPPSAVTKRPEPLKI